MQETEQLITLYHTGFIIFLILTILFAALSVLLFFLFKIRRVFDYLTGRAEKDRVFRQMEEENAPDREAQAGYIYTGVHRRPL